MSKRAGSCSRSPSPTASSSKRRRIDEEGNLCLEYPDAPSSSGSRLISLIHGTSLAPPNGGRTSSTRNSQNPRQSTSDSLTCSSRSKSTEIDPEKPSVLSTILQIQSQVAALNQVIIDLREEVTQMKEEVREVRSEIKVFSGSEGNAVMNALKEQKQDLSSLKFSVDSFRLVLGDSLGKSKTTGVSGGNSTQEEQTAWRSSFMKEMSNSRQGFGLFQTASQTFVPIPAASGAKRTSSHSTPNINDKSKPIQKATSTSQRPISTLAPRSSTSTITTSTDAHSTSHVVTTAPRRVEKPRAGSFTSIASTVTPSDTEPLTPSLTRQTQQVTPPVTVTSLNSPTRNTRSSASPTPRNTRSSTTSTTSTQKLPLPSEFTPSISAPLPTHTSLPASSTTLTPRLHDLWSAPPIKSSISVSNPSSTKKPGILLTHAQISATSTAETYNPDKRRRPRHVTAFGCKVPEEVGEEWEFELPGWVLDGLEKLEEVNPEMNHAEGADDEDPGRGDEQDEDMAGPVVEGKWKERYEGLAEKVRRYREWAKNNDCSYYSYWWWNTSEAVNQGASSDASRAS